MKRIEIGRVVGPKGDDGNPIGTIISFMGTSAPDGYLICDGSTVSYSNYTALGDFFTTQFGSRIYFGGTENNFALPDLRNRFLRGYHGAAEEMSDEIGVNQNATILPYIALGGGGELATIVLNPPESSLIENCDSVGLNGAISKRYSSYKSIPTTSYPTKYTTRPINVAILFCIKYM